MRVRLVSKTARGRSFLLATTLLTIPLAAGSTQPAPGGPSPAQPPPIDACLGHWDGAGRNGNGAPWPIRMMVTSLNGPDCGTIEYPSLGCGGRLTNCSTRSGQTTFVEAYTHNAGRCAPDGTIVARCTTSAMQWVWVGDDLVQTSLARR